MTSINTTHAPAYVAPKDDTSSTNSGDRMGLGGAQAEVSNDDLEAQAKLFEQQLGIYHGEIADSMIKTGLYGNDGEQRAGLNTSATGIEGELDFGKMMGDNVILQPKIEVGRAIANVSGGEDGANFNVGAPVVRVTCVGGVSDPNNNHDGQGTVGLSLADPIPLPSGQLHWSDDDKDGYREFGFGGTVPIVPGISVVVDFKMEIGVSDKDFIKFGDDIKAVALNFANDTKDAFDKLDPVLKKGWDDFAKDANQALDPNKNGVANALDPEKNGTNAALDPNRNGAADAFDPEKNGTNETLDPNRNGAKDAFDPEKNGTNKAMDPERNGVSDAFKKAFKI